MGEQTLRLGKIFLFSAVLGLVFSGAAIPDVFAPGPRVMSIALVYSGDGGTLVATDKNGVPHIVDAPGGTSIVVADGDVVVITPGPGTKHADNGELDTETLITVDGVSLLIGNDLPTEINGVKQQVENTNLHTSCSKEIVVDQTFVDNNVVDTLLVVGTFEDDGINPCDPNEEPPLPPTDICDDLLLCDITGAQGPTGPTGPTGAGPRLASARKDNRRPGPASVRPRPRAKTRADGI